MNFLSDLAVSSVLMVYSGFAARTGWGGGRRSVGGGALVGTQCVQISQFPGGCHSSPSFLHGRWFLGSSVRFARTHIKILSKDLIYRLLLFNSRSNAVCNGEKNVDGVIDYFLRNFFFLAGRSAFSYLCDK